MESTKRAAARQVVLRSDSRMVCEVEAAERQGRGQYAVIRFRPEEGGWVVTVTPWADEIAQVVTVRGTR